MFTIVLGDNNTSRTGDICFEDYTVGEKLDQNYIMLLY